MSRDFQLRLATFIFIPVNFKSVEKLFSSLSVIGKNGVPVPNELFSFYFLIYRKNHNFNLIEMLERLWDMIPVKVRIKPDT